MQEESGDARSLLPPTTRTIAEQLLALLADRLHAGTGDCEVRFHLTDGLLRRWSVLRTGGARELNRFDAKADTATDDMP